MSESPVSDVDGDGREPVTPRAAGAPAIEVAGLSKRYEVYRKPHHRLLQTLLRGQRTFYQEFWALRDVSMTVHRGETVGIIGRNGSGKSTLLQLVAGTLTPTTGTVRTHGRVAALLELGSGFNLEFTGRENVYLNGAILGISRREMDEKFAAIERFADIGEFIDQPVKTYSSGMMVRLAFAVAVQVTPDVLIVDEALSVGDAAFQAKCLERIRRLQESGVAILLVSHSANTIIEFCDRAAYLDRGRLVSIGACREVIECYTNDLTRYEAQAAVAFTAPTQAAVPTPPPAEAPPPGPDSPPAQILEVRVTDAKGVPKAAFSYGEEVRVAMDVAFHRANDAPCFGIQLKSVDDIALWAQTTAHLNLRPAAVQAGTRLTFAWTFRAMTGGSRFVIALGVGDNASGEYRRHDRLSYAGTLRGGARAAQRCRLARAAGELRRPEASRLAPSIPPAPARDRALHARPQVGEVQAQRHFAGDLRPVQERMHAVHEPDVGQGASPCARQGLRGRRVALRVEESVLAVPPADALVAPEHGAQQVERRVAILAEQPAPVAVRLLVDVMRAALPRIRGREQDEVRGAREACDERGPRGRLEVLGGLERHDEVDARRRLEWPVEVDRREADRRIDHLRSAVPVAVEAQQRRGALVVPGPQPGSAAAADIQDRRGLHVAPQIRNVDARRGEQVGHLLVVPTVVVEAAEGVVGRGGAGRRIGHERGVERVAAKCTRGQSGRSTLHPATGTPRVPAREAPARPAPRSRAR